MFALAGCPVVSPPGHDPAGPGNSENAPGHNKLNLPPGQAKKAY
ncbi:conserved domain protein [delta proteobacterium NaphS2]|nr:conserved domain protein [delta proteobacterium NaphS2]